MRTSETGGQVYNEMKNFRINAVQRLIPRMTLDEGRGWGRRTGRFAIDSTVELKFLVEVFNIEEGDDSNGYERHNLGQHGLEKMKENRRGHRLKKILNNYIHKATWQSPYHVMENHTDHMCISRRSGDP